MLSGEIWHRILQVSFVECLTPSNEFQAIPVPASVCVVPAGDAVRFPFVLTVAGAVRIPTTPTYIGLRGTFRCEMAPSSALHALDGFMLLLLWSDFCSADECYDPEPSPQFSVIFPPFILRSQSLVLHSFPYAPLGPSPNHLTSHLMDHMTNPQSTITCHRSAVRSIMTCPHLTLSELPAHDVLFLDRQLMMEPYLELPRHDIPY